MESEKVNTNSFDAYKNSCLKIIRTELEDFFGKTQGLKIEQIELHEDTINAYSNLKVLKDIDMAKIFTFDNNKIDTTLAEEAVLNGEFFWEHAAAGEATRLGIGTKYVVDLSKMSPGKIKELIFNEIIKSTPEEELKEALQEASEKYSDEKLIEMMGGNSNQLYPLSLGTRHMFQMIFDIIKVAKKHNKDPSKVLKKQKTLLILNEKTQEKIIKQILKYNFFGLDPLNFYFMVQKSFNGIKIENGLLSFYESDNLRLHNHGQMVMQKTHPRSIFRIINDEKIFVEPNDFQNTLKSCKDLLSYNIEDIDYLTGAIDYPSLAVALNLGKRGYNMVMEIVSQNPIKPQKGGAAFFDPMLNRNVMVESNRLKGIRNEDIKQLNKNFNHYTNPAVSYQKLRENGLPLPFEVKKGNDGNKYIYPCPVQGDINFLVKTAFVIRKNVKPINNWKSAATTPPAIKAMFDQQNQEGFMDFVKEILDQ